LLPIKSGRGTQPDDTAATDRIGTVLTLGSMEVIDLLPDGLSVCRFCGAVRGTTAGGRESLCLCDGITCRYCGLGRTFRPCSDHFEWQTRSFWHMPYFGGWHPCDPCVRLARRVESNPSFPGPLTSDPRLRSLLGVIREAHQRLAPPSAQSASERDRGAIVAAHAPVHVWRELGLEPPADDRPLWVGLAVDYVESSDDRVYVASCAPPAGHDLVELVTELDLRWRPPYRKYLPWDPSRHVSALSE
jgi:hypothetical protein